MAKGKKQGRRSDAERRVVAVTGACGFTGAELLKRLEDDRRVAKVLALDIRKPSTPFDKVEFHKVDLTLPTADADLAGLLAREEVDTVVHAAFLSSPTHASAWAHELEDIGTMHVLAACAEARVPKLVAASTTLVYGADPVNPNYLDEERELRGTGSAFIADKVGAEKQMRRFAEQNDTCVTVLRVAPTIGPTVHNFVTRFLSWPIAPVLMGYDPLVQLVHEQDVVDAFKLVVDRDVPGAFNIAADGVLPYSTVLAMMGKLPVPLPGFLADRLARALWAVQVADAPPAFLAFLRYLCVADNSKARKVLGFSPRHDIRATILDFLGVAQGEDELARARA